MLAIVGGLLVLDRPGLEASYFALGEPWEGRPYSVGVGEPGLASASEVSEHLSTEALFSIRWTGWWYVARAGEHRFALAADDAGYLRIDGELVSDTDGRFGKATSTGSVTLDSGFHTIEIGLYQRDGASFLEVGWSAPGKEESAELSIESLFSGGPLRVRRSLRGLLASWSRPFRQLLGVAVLIGLLVLLRRRLGEAGDRIGDWAKGLGSGRARIALLTGLFIVTFLGALQFAAYLRGGDAAAYLIAATFDKEYWFSNRYGHVYLLKLFISLAGGDPLLGASLWWSFVFATTVSALALAVKSVGSGLQLRTLAVTLFILLAQTSLMGLIGHALADFSAMMFVTLAVGIYIHAYLGAEGRPAPRREWAALIIGILTVGASRSKEVGTILVALPAFFLLVDGRVDLRRFVRRMLWWTVGVVAALALLTVLDAWILDDPFFTVGSERLERLDRMNFPEGRTAKPGNDWLKTIWTARHRGVDLSLRFLWLGVCAGAIAAGLARRRVEERLLHLLPIAYLAAIVLLYVRLPHPFSPRMLLTMTPVACLMTGLVFHYAGLDEIPWRRLLAPGVVIPGGFLAALLVFFLLPWRRGTLEAADFLPVAWLERFGWSPDHFMLGVVVPLAFLGAVTVAALGATHRPQRVVALGIVGLVVFGAGFAVTLSSLTAHRANQDRALLTYPWKSFGDELAEVPNASVGLSADLLWPYRMTMRTRTSIACVSLRRSDVFVSLARDYPQEADFAIASRRSWTRWRRGLAPSLERALIASATWDRTGLLVLLRPRAAADDVERLSAMAFSAEEMPDLYRLLADLPSNETPGAREHLLERILASDAVRLRSLEGDRLRAVGLSADGWSSGRRAAGLILTNRGDGELTQSLRLSVLADAAEYPISVVIGDEGATETVIFEKAGRKTVTLRPLQPGASRLVTIRSDREWTRPDDERVFGVRVRSAGSRVDESPSATEVSSQPLDRSIEEGTVAASPTDRRDASSSAFMRRK